MAEFFCYEEIKDNGTFTVDEKTVELVKDNPRQIEGKVVTLTGDFEVGYGSSGDRIQGFVANVLEPWNNAENEKMCVAVRWHVSKEFVDCSGSEKANAYLACDGKGGVVTTTTHKNAVCWGLQDEPKKCTVHLL